MILTYWYGYKQNCQSGSVNNIAELNKNFSISEKACNIVLESLLIEPFQIIQRQAVKIQST